jgi:hypothetical protein
MWKKSSYSKSNGNCLEWRASTSGQCVRVRGADVRDSRDPGGPVLSFDGSTWGRFLAGIKSS